MNYDWMRAILAVAQLGVAWLVWRRSVGYTWAFMFLMVASGIFNLAPAHPDNEAWKHWVQVPSYGVLLALTVAATAEAYAFLRRHTFPRERWLILAMSSLLSAAVVVAGWAWRPENWYQAFMIARQYALVALCVAHSAAWQWVTCGRRVHMEVQTECHGTLWAIWLGCAALLSSTTKGGLWWMVFRWEGGVALWQVASGALMLAQIWLCAGFALNLQRWRRVGWSPG